MGGLYMIRRHRTVLARLVMLAAAMLALGGCGQSLDDLVRSISRSQSIDESFVRRALSEGASGSDDQLRLAKEWEAALPDKPLPNLESTWDDLAAYGRDQLRAATCEAVLETLQTGVVPDGQTFVTKYLAGNAVPTSELQSVVDEFDELWREAEAGTLTATDVRFTLMKLRYC